MTKSVLGAEERGVKDEGRSRSLMVYRSMHKSGMRDLGGKKCARFGTQNQADTGPRGLKGTELKARGPGRGCIEPNQTKEQIEGKGDPGVTAVAHGAGLRKTKIARKRQSKGVASRIPMSAGGRGKSTCEKKQPEANIWGFVVEYYVAVGTSNLENSDISLSCRGNRSVKRGQPKTPAEGQFARRVCGCGGQRDTTW